MDPQLLLTIILFCSTVTVIALAVVTGRAITPAGDLILKALKSDLAENAYIIIGGAPTAHNQDLIPREGNGLTYPMAQEAPPPEGPDQPPARRRTRPLPTLANNRNRRQVLEESLERYREIYVIYMNNLSIVEERKALLGFDAGVEVENQIRVYGARLQETKDKLAEIVEELNGLGVIKGNGE